MTQSSPDKIAALAIITLVIIGAVVILMFHPNPPWQVFRDDPSAVQVCYLNISYSTFPLIEGGVTRMVDGYHIQRECVDRNFTIVSSKEVGNVEYSEISDVVVKSGLYPSYGGRGVRQP